MYPKKLILFLAAGLEFGGILDAERLAKFEPPDGQIYLGYCASDYWSEALLTTTLDTIHREVSSKPFALYSMFVHTKENGRWNGWNYNPQGPDGRPIHGSGKYIKAIRDRGYTPVVAWTWMDWRDHSQSPTLQGVVRGDCDWYLDEWIEGIREFGDPIFIRLSHEMDGYWYPYSEGYLNDPHRNTAEDYIAYWRYVVNRFREAGVDNVAWVWCVSGGRSGARDWVDYYPGDAYVDWIAADVYSNKIGGQVLRDLQATMGEDKPIMIPEGGTEDLLSPYNRLFQGNAAWVEEFYSTIVYGMKDQVKAVCWFQWNEHGYLQRDPEQLEVYRRYVETDRFISELVVNLEIAAPPVPAPAQLKVNLASELEIERGSSDQAVKAELLGAAGNWGCRWSVESGDPSGLVLGAEGCEARLRALSPGVYQVKFQAWDVAAHDSAYLTVRVKEGDAQPDMPAVVLPDVLYLKQGDANETVKAELRGLAQNFGGRWSVEQGDPAGLLLDDRLTEVGLRAARAGTYVLKAQYWDGQHHVSDSMEVIVSQGLSSAYPLEPAIEAPEWVELPADGATYELPTTYVGFEPKGGKWSVESGPAEGLQIIGEGEVVYLASLLPGEYVLKTQAWRGDIHVSAYIRVTVLP